jgi:hypothetical protein
VDDIDAHDSGAAIVGRHDAREHAQGRGFTGAVWTNQSEDFALTHVE